MKKIMFIIAGLIVFSLTVLQAGEHIKDAVVVLKSPTGKTYKATTDASGRCVFRDLDCDGDGWSVKLTYQKITFKSNDKSTFSVTEVSSSSSKIRESPTKSSISSEEVSSSTVTSPRDAASGQASGKRTHKPFVIRKELCPNGTCADNRVEVTLESDGTTITAMAIQTRGAPATKETK